MFAVRLFGSTPPFLTGQHGADRNQVDVRCRRRRAVRQVAAAIADVGDFEQARPRRALRHREAVAVGVRLLVVLAVDRRRRQRCAGEVERIELACASSGTPVDWLPDRRDRLHARRHIQSVGELAGVVVVAAPTAAKHGLAGADEIVGQRQSAAGRTKRGSGIRRSARSDRACATRSRSSGSACKLELYLRVIEDRVTVSQAVDPRREVSHAQTEVRGSAAC